MMTQETVFNNANTRAEAILKVLQTLRPGELLNSGQQLLKITDVLRISDPHLRKEGACRT